MRYLIGVLAVVVALALGWHLLRPAPELMAWLDSLPEVSVSRVLAPHKPIGTIVHLLDWHLGDEKQRADDEHLEQVERVQVEHLVILEEFLDRGIETFGVEGLTADEVETWDDRIQELRGNPHAALTDRQRRLELAELGVTARLQVLGQKVNTFGLDSWKELEDATPKKVNGGWVFDQVKVRARRVAIVRNCVATGKDVVVIILGAAHDLRDVIEEQAPGWGYIRITTASVAVK